MSEIVEKKWKYSIVLIQFPFADELSQSKPRPALCLCEPVGKYNEIVVAFISSKIPYQTLATDFIFTKEMEHFEVTGLSHNSVIRLHKISTVNAEIITQIFGRIEGVKNIKIIQQKLKNFFF